MLFRANKGEGEAGLDRETKSTSQGSASSKSNVMTYVMELT